MHDKRWGIGKRNKKVRWKLKNTNFYQWSRANNAQPFKNTDIVKNENINNSDLAIQLK